jgi:O-antigen ligase
VAYLSLIALFLTVTNFVPVSAIGFAPIVLCVWRFFGGRFPAFVTALVSFAAYALLSTVVYDPASLIEFEFYRRDGNLFVSYAPILAGCVYAHRWDLNKLLKYFFVFAVVVNVPSYLLYLTHYSPLAPLTDPMATFGSYFIARNAAGGFLAMLFCLGVACYFRQRSALLLALLALNAAMLLSTYSRGSFLGLAALVPYLLLGRKRWVLACMIVVMIAASFAVAMYHTLPSTDYMGFPFAIHNSDAKAGTLDIRYQWLWPRALAYFRQSPLVGLGFGSFDDHISMVVDYFGVFGAPLGVDVVHSDSHAHNSYLNTLAELGIVGLVLLLRFFWELIGWAANGAAAALKEGGRNYVAFSFIELSAVCLLAMSYSEHRLTTPSNVLIMSLVTSLLLASRVPDSVPVRLGRTLPRTREVNEERRRVIANR